MTAHCIVCEQDIELDIDTFLEVKQDDFICDDCAEIILEYAADWFNEMELRKN